MPEFIYRGSDVRTYYPPGAPAVEAHPGETYTLNKDPGDGRWAKKPARKPSKKAATKAETKQPATKPAPAPAGESKE